MRCDFFAREKECLILNAETMFGVLVFIAMFANVIGTILGGSDNWSK